MRAILFLLELEETKDKDVSDLYPEERSFAARLTDLATGQIIRRVAQTGDYSACLLEDQCPYPVI